MNLARIACIGVITLFCACSSPSARQQSQTAEEQKRTAPVITQFYASPPNVARGEKTLLCYGVENASAVRLTPSVEKVWPAPTRCIQVTPSETTTYTLTADGASGQSISKTVEVTVGPPRAHIVEVVVSALEVTRGTPVRVCYTARNGTSVKAGPGRFVGAHTPDKGCLLDTPQNTTTYTVTVSGPGGSTDSEQVTVRVR